MTVEDTMPAAARAGTSDEVFAHYDAAKRLLVDALAMSRERYRYTQGQHRLRSSLRR